MDNSSDISDLSEEGQVIVSILLKKMDENMNELLEIIEKKDKKIDELSHEVTTLKHNYMKLEEKYDDHESYGRRNDILISGEDITPVSDDENCIQTTCDLLKRKLKVKVNAKDIMQACRIGKRRETQAADKRGLLVTLTSPELRKDVFDACKKVRPDNIFINENLIPKRSSILYVLRQAKKKFPDLISGCSSSGMSVFAWVKPPRPDVKGARNIRTRVNTPHKLREFCENVFKCQITDVIDDVSKLKF